ncbi:MAG: GNAT family N-acetyltransferase [Gemmatimonadales bacterium]
MSTDAGGSAAARVIETARLALRRLTTEDAAFMLGLANEPSYLRYIGDKGIRSAEDAAAYLLKGPIDSYARNGFGLYHVSLKEDDLPIGICGLVKRDGLEHPDVGFAFLPAYWSQGLAFEAASAVLDYGRETLTLHRIFAITQPDNASSIRLLQRLGLVQQGVVRMPTDDHDVLLFELGA